MRLTVADTGQVVIRIGYVGLRAYSITECMGNVIDSKARRKIQVDPD